MTLNDINASILQGYMIDNHLTIADVAEKSGIPEEEIRRLIFGSSRLLQKEINHIYESFGSKIRIDL